MSKINATVAAIQKAVDDTAPFTASIETTAGKSHQHGFHLGTQEPLARMLVKEIFHNRQMHGQPVVTVALMRHHKIVDVFYGNVWHSEGYDEPIC